ncbi:MAG: hypothetical protein P4L43_08590 [Syntrophobacteraceae bacterium]|nr:hypothetical protein [Syntrophobacteraceae bacterium]
MWDEKEFPICAKTYPEYSSKYVETVCTAAILKDTGRLIRLYPIPYRYLVGEHRFKKYQWVRAKIERNLRDDRPESYSIIRDSIRLGDIVQPQNNWLARRQIIFSSPENSFGSLEALQECQKAKRTSLGIIRLKEITRFHVRKKSEAELAEENQKKRRIDGQLSFDIEKKELDIIPYRFQISFACDHSRCNGHKISILDWEFGQLYRKVIESPNWEEKMRQKMEQLCSKDKDVHFFMGNMASRRMTFCILGIFYPPKGKLRQLTIFPS